MIVHETNIVLKQGDITEEAADVIVNAANSGLMGGGGVDGAIHRAGGPSIKEECRQIVEKSGRLPVGEAVITNGGDLPAKHVVHTVGPVWKGGGSNEEELLKSAYRNSLKKAAEAKAESIAFPSISTGAYGFPIDRAAPIALKAVKTFAEQDTRIKEVRFVLFSESDYHVYKEALKQ